MDCELPTEMEKMDGKWADGRREAIERMIQRNDLASEELRAANAALNPRADGVFETLETLFSSLIHSGKNYLGPIKGYASLIQDDSADQSNTRRWADKIVRNVDQMECFLDTLTAFRVKGATGVRPFSWPELLSGVLKTTSIANRRRLPIEIDCDGGCAFRQHDVLLSRVLTHLVANAVESVAGEGRVRIRVRFTRGDGRSISCARVEVIDDGCGIDDARCGLVWNPFYTTKTGHAGLGLSYVATAVPILGAQIQIESMVDRGTTVALSLPEQGGGIE